MDYITIIGLTAAALGGISLFPQLLRVLNSKVTGEDITETIYGNFTYTQEGGKSCQNVRIAQRTRKDPIKNGTLGDSKSRCTNALNVEINLENISRKAHCNLC